MSLIASFMNLAGPDLIVILLIVLVLFGAKKLPELARGMGQAVKEFQKAKDEFNDELHKAGKSDTQIAKPELKPAESTVARSDSQGASSVAAPQATAAVPPGDKGHQHYPFASDGCTLAPKTYAKRIELAALNAYDV